jgi:hypothetical protein
LSNIWVGDFRIKSIQEASLKAEPNDDKYFFDDSAEYYWFSSVAINKFVAELTEKSAVILMPGFNDCIKSCVWPIFSINKIAEDYVSIINELVDQHSGINFYICSVNPINAGYPFANYTDDIISMDDLNKQIQQFNDVISTCSATYIDSYSYLTSTGFSTRDGVRFSSLTAEDLRSYILSHVKKAPGGTTFKPRVTPDDAPISKDSSDDESTNRGSSDDIEFWRGSSHNGLNPFDNLPGHTNEKYPGDTLPNCTAYAWGRFYEILGSRPTLSTGNAEDWYGNSNDGYKRGNTPALGAIICWEGAGEGAGHVAVVEQINDDGSIITSESGWNSDSYWWTTTRNNKNGNWGANSSYVFQGFIYCPVTMPVTKEEIRSENSWSVFTVDDAMKKNAQYIWQYFGGTKGWTINAVAALLGNMQHESGMSPGIWESTVEGSVIHPDGTQSLNMSAINAYINANGRAPGYGLVQWTSYEKYYNWCQDGSSSNNGEFNSNDTGGVLPYWDMDSQLARIDWEARNNKQWKIATYNEDYTYKGEKFSSLSFSDFITSTKDVNWLTAAFAFSYEKPASSDDTDQSTITGNVAEEKLTLCTSRGADGEFWYKYLNSLPLITADTQHLEVRNLKVASYGATSVSISFIAKNAESYILNTDPDNEITITDEITIFPLENLIPNKAYTINITVKGINDEEITKSLDFITLQDYPETPAKIALKAVGEKLPNDEFQLTIKPIDYWGYWKKNDYDYVIQLIVNGKVVATINKQSLDKLWIFSLSKDFNWKACKIGDTVQIGVRTCVRDDAGKPIYDDQAAKASNPICFIKRPIVSYLNT